MRTGNIQSPMNGSLTPRHDDDVSNLSNPTSSTNNGMYRQVVVQGTSGSIRNPTFLRTSQGQILLIAAPTNSNVQGLPFAQSNLAAVPVQIPQQLINNINNISSSPSSSQSSIQSSVPPDPVPPSAQILRHPTPPPVFHATSSPSPQQMSIIGQQSSSSTSASQIQMIVANTPPVVGQNVVINSSTSSSSSLGNHSGANHNQMVVTSAGGQQQNQGGSTFDADLKKCIRFLSTLLKLARDRKEGSGGQALVDEVTNLVSSLLADQITPLNFTNKIQDALNSKPQPHLLPFLTNMLPHVQKAYRAGEFTFEGLNGPSAQQPSSINAAAPIRLAAPNSNMGSPAMQHYLHSTSQNATYTAMVQPSSSMTMTTMGPATIRASIPSTTIGGGGTTVFTTAAAPIAGPYVVAGHLRPQAPSMTGPGQQPPPRQPVQYTSVVAHQQLSQGGSAGGSPRQQLAPPAAAATSTSAPRPTAPSPRPSAPMAKSPSAAPARPQRPPAKSGAAGSSGGGAKAGQQAGAHPQPPATPEKYREPEDDINDVAAMGGVNLAEESQKIMASTAEILSTETRSCGKDEDFLHANPLAARIRHISQRFGLHDARPEVLSLISHATQERLKDLVEKLALIAEHRTEPLRNNPLYEQVNEVRSQLRFLEDLSKKDYVRREEREKEMVLKMARSRSSKLGDSEQQRMKERAKELQKAEQEEMRNRDANIAAQLALSSTRKRPAAAMSSNQTNANDSASTSNANPFASGSTASGSTGEATFRTQLNRPRYKRVNLRDLQFLLSQEREARQSRTFYRSVFK